MTSMSQRISLRKKRLHTESTGRNRNILHSFLQNRLGEKELCPDEFIQFPESAKHLQLKGSHYVAWRMEDISKSGVLGNAKKLQKKREKSSPTVWVKSWRLFCGKWRNSKWMISSTFLPKSSTVL